MAQIVDENAIAILGGTGDQGLGLALRFARAGRPIVIGSRKPERARAAAEEVRKEVPEADVSGFENPDAAARAPTVILSVPFEHAAATIKSTAAVLEPPQIVVSMSVPLATAVGDGPARTVSVWQGSCAELVASLVPKGVHVVSAFQNVSAHRLRDLEHPVECDVVVSGAPDSRRKIMALCTLIPGVRPVDGGALANARIVEQITALLIGMNIRYRVPEGVGLRFTGLPEDPPKSPMRAPQRV